jgi:hypothetical protein
MTEKRLNQVSTILVAVPFTIENVIGDSLADGLNQRGQLAPLF